MLDALSDFKAIVDDTDLADVILEGNDGVRVPAVRAMLAARSDVFRKMLCGDFREAAAATVPLEYSGAVLRCIVEFCYADEIDVTANTITSDDDMRKVVGIAAASHYLGLRSLEAKILDIVAAIKGRLLEASDAPMACSMLDEATRFGPPTKYLAEIALCTIRMKPDFALVVPSNEKGPKCQYAGLLSLSPLTFELVLKDEYICSTEIYLFECLVSWTEGGRHDATAPKQIDASNSIFPRRERVGLAASLVPFIDFSRIAPSDLGGIVSDSGLVSPEIVHAAFRSQALSWEKAKDFQTISASHRNKAPAAPDGSSPPTFMVAAGSGVDEVNGEYVLSSFDAEVSGAKAVWENTNGKITMMAELDGLTGQVCVEIGEVLEMMEEDGECNGALEKSRVLYTARGMKNRSGGPDLFSRSTWHIGLDGVCPRPSVFTLGVEKGTNLETKQ